MPNHVHLILQLPDSVDNLNSIISNGKRFIAYELVKKLNQQDEQAILHLLSMGCSDKEKAKRQKHKVFEPSFDAKPVYTTEFFQQKLDYIHHNPVIGKWMLCDEFTDYTHSSAAYYYDNKSHPLVDIMNYKEKYCGRNNDKSSNHY